MNEGNYEEAVSIFSSLSDKGYKDSHEKAQMCADRIRENNYDSAKDYFVKEQYSDAIELFAKLQNYEDSNELRAICEQSMLSGASVGDIVSFGLYEQDGSEQNGAEPIKWIVVGRNNDNILLLSEYVLEIMRFADRDSGIYWRFSNIRDWLNNDFYNLAFSDEEEKLIQNMITSDETNDAVFCLSAEEARGLFSSDESRIAYPTQALLQNGFRTWSNDNPSAEWWTRSISTASNGKGIVIVEGDGNVLSVGCAPSAPNQYSYTDIGPRPVICVNISGNVSQDAQNMSLFGFNSSRDLDNEPDLWGSSNNSSGKCPVCNGTGYVRYYYGESALEAWLDGQEDFTVGECTSCGGTGK